MERNIASTFPNTDAVSFHVPSGLCSSGLMAWRRGSLSSYIAAYVHIPPAPYRPFYMDTSRSHSPVFSVYFTCNIAFILLSILRSTLLFSLSHLSFPFQVPSHIPGSQSTFSSSSFPPSQQIYLLGVRWKGEGVASGVAFDSGGGEVRMKKKPQQQHTQYRIIRNIVTTASRLHVPLLLASIPSTFPLQSAIPARHCIPHRTCSLHPTLGTQL